jgi:hypothetical protein
MKNFEIDPSYLCSVTIRTEHKSKYENTEEDLIRALKYSNNSYSVSSVDHPEFAKLREELGTAGYIEIQRGWWNGDMVLKPFSINGAKFKKNEPFHSGAAIRYTITSKLKK